MLNDLYQEVILDHSKQPRNFGAGGANQYGRRLQPAVRRQGHALSGRRKRRGQRREVSGFGMRHLDRLGIADDRKVEGQDRRPKLCSERFHDLLTTEQRQSPGLDLGKLAVFSGVHEFRRA